MSLTVRQSELADVALAIVAREGMAAVTFRAVAAESGWSLGAVQKAFRAKDELVRAMFIRLRERGASPSPGGETRAVGADAPEVVDAPVVADAPEVADALGVADAPVAAGAPPSTALHVRLVESFVAMMPLDADARAVTLQRAAFTERAAFDPRIAGAVAASDREHRRRIATLVRREQEAGTVPMTVDADAVAWAFLALAAGTASQLLYAPLPIAKVRALASAVVFRLVPAESPR